MIFIKNFLILLLQFIYKMSNKNKKNRILIISGFHRSGTSLLTKFLNLMDYDTGGSWNSEINAGYEDENFQKIVTAFQMNALTEDLILFLEKEIQKIDKMVLKHPRLLMNPELLRIWTNIYPKTSVLVTYREPIYALESKKSFGNLGYYTNYSPSELDKKFHVFIDTLLHLRLKHHILYFPNFLEDYDEVYHAISSLGIHIDRDKGREIWHEIVDINKVHFGKDKL